MCSVSAAKFLPGLHDVLPHGAVASMYGGIRRALWPVGPWTHEHDRIEWRAHGFVCLISRASPSGHLCGYVGVEPGHPWHGLDFASYVETPLERPSVHGGITYSEHCQDHVCHVPAPGEPEHLFWQGFDAMHAWDVSPSRADEAPCDGSYKTITFMIRETERLAEQARAVAP